MEKIDKLSKRSDWKVGVERIKIVRGKDKEVVRVIEEMKKIEVKVLREDEWQIKGNLVLKEGKVYILKNKGLRVKIIQLHYNVPVAKYRGRWKTTELVMRNYW